MKKMAIAMALAVVMLLTVAAGQVFAGAQSPTVMFNGVQIAQSCLTMQDGKVYVDIEQFNKFPGVMALDNYGLAQVKTGTEGPVPEQETSVAGLIAQEKSWGISIVVNKTDDTAYIASISSYEIPGQSGDFEFPAETSPLKVIIDGQGIVFVPLRQVAGALGANVAWDAASNTVTVSTN